MPSDKKGCELYDLSSDIGEQTNLIKQHPEIIKLLEAKMTDILCSGRTTPGTRQSNDTGWWNAVSWMTPEEYSEKHPEGESETSGKKSERKRKDSTRREKQK